MDLNFKICLGAGAAFGAGVGVGVLLCRYPWKAKEGLPQILPVESTKGEANDNPQNPALLDVEIQAANKKLLPLVGGHRVSQCLYAVCLFDVASILGRAGSPLSVAEIAVEIQRSRGKHAPQVHVEGLRRILRFLAQHEVFSETQRGHYGLTDISQVLRCDVEGPSMRWLVLHDLCPGMWNAWAKLPDVVGQRGYEGMSQKCCAFTEAHGGISNFEYKSRHPEVQRAFNMMLSLKSSADATAVADWDGWSELPEGARFTDVGGSRGTVCDAVKRRWPKLHVVNFDLPHVVAAIPKIQGVAHVGGDFFDPKSIPLSDVILLRKILHDWNDEDCGRILQNVKSRLCSGGKLLVDEILVPDPGKIDPTKRFIFSSDVQMMTMNGAGERTLEDWKRLLSANSLEVVSVIPLGTWVNSLLVVE